MKKLITLIAISLFLVSCATGNIQTSKATDGTTTCSASYGSSFKDITGFTMHACDGSAGATDSVVDNASINTVLTALIKAFSLTLAAQQAQIDNLVRATAAGGHK